jgi:hypothetical protein
MVTFLDKLNFIMNQTGVQDVIPESLKFNPESCGQSTVYVPNVRQMYRIHGKVVNELYTTLKEGFANKTIFNNQLIDIAISDRGNLEKIFEVKTGNDKQSIYTGIGQLLFHSKADKNVVKILVLPKCANGYEEFYELFDEMGIWISEYYLDEDDVITFEYLP